MFKEPQKEKLVLDLVCDICGKPIAAAKEKSDVTRFLLTESRCQCVRPEQKPVESSDKGPSTHQIAIGNQRSEPEPPAAWKQKFASALENIPNHYQLLSLLGVGGMGAVFKCLDSKKHRICAIKTLRPQFVTNANAIARFKHEAKAASKLHHDNLAEIYSFGVGIKGAPYLVMECIDGETLSQTLSLGRPLSANQSLDLFIQIADVLQFAHSKGIIHRDIKPSNIIVEHMENGKERVRLLDFGIAKTLFLDGAVTQGLTQTGEIFGSPPYMSPEQCEGNPQNAQSDIYAFGCVMFECLVGHTPFQSHNPIRMILDHLEKPAPLVSESTKNFVPKHLSEIINRCLQKDPNARFRTVAEIKKELMSCHQWLPIAELDNEPPPPPPTKRIDLDGETMVHFNKTDETTLAIQSQLMRMQKLTGRDALNRKESSDEDEILPLLSESELKLLLNQRSPTPLQRFWRQPSTRILATLFMFSIIALPVAIHYEYLQNAIPPAHLKPLTLPTASHLPEVNPNEVPTAMLKLAEQYMNQGRYDLARPLLNFCSLSARQGPSDFRDRVSEDIHMCVAIERK